MPQPVATFLRLSLDLKTALADCLAKPATTTTPKIAPKTVHSLRATIRRLEATLGLLVDTTDLPDLPRRSRLLGRSLRRVRHAAGKVRDLDVHCELLATCKTIRDTSKLTQDLAAARKRREKKLQQHIRQDRPDILRVLDKLEPILAPAADLDLSGGSLVQAARTSLAPALRGLDPTNDDGLHAIRKACKSARYIAEIGGSVSTAAASLAQRLIDFQHTAGAWHDHLILLKEAQAALPTDSPLTDELRVKTTILRRQAESRAARLMSIKASKPFGS